MRDVNRLNNLYNTLQQIHRETFPDWRFGQLMSNFLRWCVSTGKCSDVFFPEDNKWEEWIIEYKNEMVVEKC